MASTMAIEMSKCSPCLFVVAFFRISTRTNKLSFSTSGLAHRFPLALAVAVEWNVGDGTRYFVRWSIRFNDWRYRTKSPCPIWYRNRMFKKFHRLKSGHMTREKKSIESLEHCHVRKSERRISPLVRMTKSGFGDLHVLIFWVIVSTLTNDDWCDGDCDCCDCDDDEKEWS